MPPGEILVQMSDTQRHLNSDLEVVVSLRLRGPEGHSGEWAAFRGGQGPASTLFLREDSGNMTTAAALGRTCQGQALLGAFTCTSVT